MLVCEVRECAEQSSTVVHRASRGRCVSGRGGFLLVTSQSIVKKGLKLSLKK